MIKRHPPGSMLHRLLHWLRQQWLRSEEALTSSVTKQTRPASLAERIARHLAGLATIAVIVAFHVHFPLANETTVGFTLLLAILCASTIWGLSVALLMSVIATLCYDFFFMPPVGVLTLSDPRDWVALGSFVVTSGIGAYLSSWARREARMANQRRLETERLYHFSQQLLSVGDPAQLLASLPQYIEQSFGTGAVFIFLTDRGQALSSSARRKEVPAEAGEANVMREVEAEKAEHVVPLRVGDLEVGKLCITEPAPSPATLEAVAALVVVGVERARAIERAAKLEAARKTEQLKEVFLDALAHDFKTPLTSIKGSATALLDNLEFDRHQRKELLTLIDEECDRINKLIVSASEMAKLDAGQIKLDLSPHSVGELISAALAECRGVARERRIDTEVKDEDAMVMVDLSLAKKVLVHLIDNANLYSLPGQPITIRAETQDGRAVFSVTDRGPGISESDLGHIFEKFYRGEGQRDRVDGTGMGLAIAAAIVRAHGGNIEAASARGKGSTFTFYLPVAVPAFR